MEELEKILVEMGVSADLPPIALDWLLHSKDRRAEAWRHWIKQVRAHEIEEARRRQALIKKEMEQMEHKGKNMRRIGIVDPVIMNDFNKRYGPGWLRDGDFIRDTREKAPELFVK
jgi:hypothetical protein